MWCWPPGARAQAGNSQLAPANYYSLLLPLLLIATSLLLPLLPNYSGQSQATYFFSSNGLNWVHYYP